MNRRSFAFSRSVFGSTVAPATRTSTTTVLRASLRMFFTTEHPPVPVLSSRLIWQRLELVWIPILLASTLLSLFKFPTHMLRRVRRFSRDDLSKLGFQLSTFSPTFLELENSKTLLSKPNAKFFCVNSRKLKAISTTSLLITCTLLPSKELHSVSLLSELLNP